MWDCIGTRVVSLLLLTINRWCEKCVSTISHAVVIAWLGNELVGCIRCVGPNRRVQSLEVSTQVVKTLFLDYSVAIYFFCTI